MSRGEQAVAPGGEETLDELLRGRIRVLQPRRGARVSVDSLLLADFALATGGGKVGRALDLCCGGGVIALALAAADPSAVLAGVELLPAFAELARRNAALNDVADRVSFIAGDVARPRALPLAPGAFDLVVANPPYRPEGGRVSPAADRALARHELACTLADVLVAARRFLRPRGRLAVVHPADRLPELLTLLVEHDTRPRVLRAVHAVASDPARRVLVEAVRTWRGGLRVDPPLVLHGPDRRSYTPEARRILG